MSQWFFSSFFGDEASKWLHTPVSSETVYKPPDSCSEKQTSGQMAVPSGGIGEGNLKIYSSDDKSSQKLPVDSAEIKPTHFENVFGETHNNNFRNDQGLRHSENAQQFTRRNAWKERTLMETDEPVQEKAQQLPYTQKLLEAMGHLKELFNSSENEVKNVLEKVLTSKISSTTCAEDQDQHQTMKKEIARLKEIETKFLCETQNLRTENKQLKEDLQKQSQVDVNNIKQSYLKEKEKLEQQDAEIKKYEARILDLQTNYKKLEEGLSEKTKSYSKLLEDKRKVDEELSRCKTRLSQVMGNKLSNNNPDIADLSDQNRPTKLAEKYQSIYDDHWTDAFEAAEVFFKDEQKRTEALKTLLVDIKGHCDKLYQRQTNTLLKAIGINPATNKELDVDIAKQVKDLRKTTAALLTEHLFQKFIEETSAFGSRFGRLVTEEKVKPFVKSCVEVCWFMLVQDPPLVFLPDPAPGEPLDTEKYKFYTKTGSNIQFVVWPALLLSEGGAVLSKGIAQAIPDLDEHGKPVPKGSIRRKQTNVASALHKSTQNLPPYQDITEQLRE